ncbi:MAG: hypothetical protein IPM55_16485 [Acidobacteria bacterium]|nr:hypothetical protein [Acidobacteriota bacterium]
MLNADDPLVWRCARCVTTWASSLRHRCRSRRDGREIIVEDNLSATRFVLKPSRFERSQNADDR